jgi:hypothetical protein
MRSTRLAFPLVLGLALSIAASARAGTYSSPFLRTPSVSYALDCVVSNVGSTPLTLTVTLYDGFGGVISPDFDACNPNTQVPGGTCSVYKLGASGRCVVEVGSSKIRAVLTVRTTGELLVAAVPLTKK